MSDENGQGASAPSGKNEQAPRPTGSTSSTPAQAAESLRKSQEKADGQSRR